LIVEKRISTRSESISKMPQPSMKFYRSNWCLQ
jgi:hypothetical protein